MGHFSELVSMTCQLLASKHVLGSQQTVHALLVLMTALADAGYVLCACVQDGVLCMCVWYVCCWSRALVVLRWLLRLCPSPPVYPYRRMFTLGGVQQSLFE